jgi:methionyl-tRNA formyltransferase
VTARPRVVLFGSGSPISTHALAAVAPQAEIAAVVVPAGPRVGGARSAVRAWRRWRSTGPLRALARAHGAAALAFDHGQPERLVAPLHALRPDLIAVATFPALLPRLLLEAAGAGAIGIHPSALPRHRGPAPLFWTYHDDDAEAGVSVFRMDGGVDTGAVLGQEVFPLERGRLGSDLYGEIARRGAALLARAVLEVASGRETAVPQDESLASHEPWPRAGRWRIDFDTWSGERVWHFLRGVGEGGRILCSARGRPLRHGPARSFVSGRPRKPPGMVERHAGGFLVHCHDGRVEVAPPWARRVRSEKEGS